MSAETKSNDTVPVPSKDDHQTHSFLLPRPERQAPHPVIVMGYLRDYIESLPSTSATFKKDDAVEAHDVHHQAISDAMMHMVGSWKVPKVSSQNRKWVNPAYSHRERLSDVLVNCECGALMARTKEVYHDHAHDSDNDHTDDCKVYWRLRARADLCEKRERALREGLLAGHSARSMAARLGVKDSIGHVAKALGVDVRTLKDEYAERRAKTIAILLTEFTQKEVGRAYGISDSTVREIIATDTPYSTKGLRDIRRSGGADAQ